MLSARVLAALFLCLAARGQNPPLEAKGLQSYIDEKGAGNVVKQLTQGDESQWRRVIRKIDSGSPEWLEVAKKLLGATDAGATEDLYASLAIALTHNPNGVLALVGTNLPLDQVCTVPFVEASDKKVKEHQLKVRNALRGVTSPALAAKKRDCLIAIAR